MVNKQEVSIHRYLEILNEELFRHPRYIEGMKFTEIYENKGFSMVFPPEVLSTVELKELADTVQGEVQLAVAKSYRFSTDAD